MNRLYFTIVWYFVFSLSPERHKCVIDKEESYRLFEQNKNNNSSKNK